MRKRSSACSIPQNDASRAVGSVARRIGGAEDCDDRNVESSGQMQRACISADEQSCAAGERDEFGERTGHRPGDAIRRGLNCARQGLFAGAIVHDRCETFLGKRPRDFTIAFWRPFFCSPSGAGIEDDNASVDVLQLVGDR